VARRMARGRDLQAEHPDARDLGVAASAERARTVASSLDLRGAKVVEALEVLDRYLDDASLAGLDQATVIHGMERVLCATPSAITSAPTPW